MDEEDGESAHSLSYQLSNLMNSNVFTSYGLPTPIVNDNGRYRQFRARPPEAIVHYVLPVTEIPELALPSSRTPRLSYG